MISHRSSPFFFVESKRIKAKINHHRCVRIAPISALKGESEGIQIGPLTEAEFEQKVMAGQVNEQTMVWIEGMAGWQPYSTLIAHVPSALSKQSCTQCGQIFAESDLVRFENSLICAKCKPIFFQSLKEGIQPVGVGVCIGITWLLIGISILVAVLATMKEPTLILLAVVIFVGALIYGILAVQPVTPAKITDRLVYLKGVNPAYLNMLSEFPNT